MTAPTVARTREQIVAALAPRTGRRAVVMTMGALHEGHLDLVRAARRAAEQVVVTIFVNPLQFAAGEDLERYPRDLEADVAALTGPGLLGAGDVVVAPGPADVYPDGEPMVRVCAGRIGTVLEGAVRPGHFDGVLTVVAKLAHLTAPDVAVFGRKDAQQLAAVRRMVRDLDLGVEILPVATRRDPDGLAMSSRNAYLSPADREQALALSRGLHAAGVVAATGADPDAVRAAATAELAAARLTPDYVALVDPDEFTPVTADHVGPATLAVAARVGQARLIDNAEVVLLPPR